MPKSKYIPADVKLWGEISDESRNIISEEVLRTLIRGAVKQEDPKLKLPVTDDEEEDSFILPSHLSKQNEYVLHTIRLNEHAKAVESLIESVKVGKTEFEKCPPLPEIPSILNSNNTSDEDDKSKVMYNFQLGQGPEIPALDNENINKMLQKAVFVTLAETGFDKAKKSSVHVLIDVVRYILTKICKLLHMFSQQDAMRGRTQFKDPLEKVLQLLGMSGINDLVLFYQKNVVGKRNLALKRSITLVNQYNSIVNKMREQAAIEADEPNLSEINVSSISLNESLKKLPEPGFQMLFDLKSEPQPGPSSSEEFPNGTSAKTIIKKRISSNILHSRTKKPKTDT